MKRSILFELVRQNNAQLRTLRHNHNVDQENPFRGLLFGPPQPSYVKIKIVPFRPCQIIEIAHF